MWYNCRLSKRRSFLMGLDMYAFKTKLHLNNEVDFPVHHSEPKERIFYWRKHPNLHTWMENLYVKKGGKLRFNCVNLQLTLDDLEQLRKDIIEQKLPVISSYYLGISNQDEEERMTDLEFVQKAEDAIKSGYTIFYTSWI